MLRLVCAILLTSVVTVTAEVSFGVNFEYNQQSTESVTKSNFSVEPFVGIRPVDLIEIDPSFAWNLSSNDEDNASNSYTVNSIEPGCGLYFHLLENGVLGFALGPQISYNFAFAPNYDNGNSQYEYE